MVVADIVVFVLGFVWLAWFATLSTGLLSLLGLAEGATGTGAAFAWEKGVEPFVIADALKIAIAALAVPAGWMLLNRNRQL